MTQETDTCPSFQCPAAAPKQPLRGAVASTERLPRGKRAGGHSAQGQDKVKGPSLGPSNHQPSTILRTGGGGGSRWLCSPEGVKTQVSRLSALGGRRLGGRSGCIPAQMLQLRPSYSQTSSRHPGQREPQAPSHPQHRGSPPD